MCMTEVLAQGAGMVSLETLVAVTVIFSAVVTVIAKFNKDYVDRSILKMQKADAEAKVEHQRDMLKLIREELRAHGLKRHFPPKNYDMPS